ncbi:class I SAM-dependent methyltransferase [Nocardia carnea]|uniref:class I SAM-dependent methyltransferase n=1 Tax=Nocardia carnea TaxID=37328 RepID=UPI0024541306|nr:class I SAM-dependent methyltransferase [Nocardia carnea]
MPEASFLTDTRAGYNAIAAAYDETYAGELDSSPWQRAILVAFAEVIGPGEPVIDIGCGPGRVTGFLSGHGLSIRGIDLSPAMVELARRHHPDIRFDVGSMTALEMTDGSLAAVVAWYSLIHIPPAARPGVLAEFHRVLRPGGRVLLGFQAGTEVKHYDEGFGFAVSLDFHRIAPEEVAATAEAAGFTVDMRFVRAPAGTEPTPQAALLLTRPS